MTHGLEPRHRQAVRDQSGQDAAGSLLRVVKSNHGPLLRLSVLEMQ